MMKKNLTFEDKVKQEYISESSEEKEKKIYLQLQSWEKRLHKLFLVFQGLLAGAALIHLYLIFFSSSNQSFLAVYGQLGRAVAVIFHSLLFIAVVGSIFTAINEQKHCKR
jgi:hypothetical protein